MVVSIYLGNFEQSETYGAKFTMNTWEMMEVLSRCERQMDMRVRQVFDLDEVASILKDAGKPFLSPILDPGRNDFTPSNCFWLVAEESGRPQIVGGVRCDDLRQMSLSAFWKRMLPRVFGDTLIDDLSCDVSAPISGKVAYFGDLQSLGDTGLSRRSQARVRLFCGIGHFLAAQEFDSDVTYCFVRDRDVMRGTPANYGFLDLVPFPFGWSSDPYPSGCPEWVAYTPKEKLGSLLGSLGRFTAE